MSESPSPSSPETRTALPLKGKMVSGSIWMIAMRWTMRFLGILNVGILARLLEQEDFGLVAMASAVMALPVMLLNLGVEQAVIRERGASPEFINTAWTLRALQMTFVSVLIYVSAPWVADYYNDARMVDIFHALAAMSFLAGLENIWTITFRTEFRFHKDFLYNTIVKILGVVITVALAIYLRSYWALVYGQILGSLAQLVVSFFVAPKRPRPTLREWRKIWSFSQWSLLNGIAQYVVQQVDRLILGRVGAAALVGTYMLGRELAELPMQEISGPVNRALGPGFAELQHEPERFAAAFLKTVGALAAVSLPVALGISTTATELVPLVLGPGWENAVSVTRILAFAGVFITMQSLFSNTLMVIGYVRFAAAASWLRAGMLIAIAIPASLAWGMEGMAYAMVIAGASGLSLNIWALCRKMPSLGLVAMLGAVLRPVIATVAMVLAVWLWRFSGIELDIALLACKTATGVVVYSGVLLLLWRQAGGPDGIESMILDGARLFLRRAAAR